MIAIASSAAAAPASPPPGPRSADLAKLRRFLGRVRRRARRWIWFEALSLIALAVTAWFWLTLLLDWLIEPPAGVRMLAVGGLAVWLAIIVSQRLIGRLQTRLGDGPLALQVERTHPELNDSLSTAIELSPAQSRPSDPIDPALLGQTTALAAATIGRVEFGRLFRRRRLLRLAGAGGLAVGTVVAVLTLVPVVRENWLRRMVLFSEAPWPRRVTLSIDGFPGGVRRVARGSDVEILVTARGVGGPPSVVELRARGRGGWMTQRMGTRGGVTEAGQRFGHTLSAVAEDLVLEIRGGDGRLRGLRIEAIEPPRQKRLDLTVTPPDYIGGGPRSLPATRLVEVPAGATVTLTAIASKPLARAEMLELTAAAPGSRSAAAAPAAPRIIARLADGPAAEPAGGRRDRRPTEPTGRLTGTVGPVAIDALIEIHFTDLDGIANQQPIRFQLLAKPDEPPRLEVALDGISTAVTPAAVIPVVGTIEDDHGLTEAAVLLHRMAGEATAAEREASAAPARHSQPILLPDRAATRLSLRGGSAPTIAAASVAAAVGDRLELTVSARDGCGLSGGPQQSVTDPGTLKVVTPDALLAMLEAREVILRRRFESMLADLQQTRDRVAGETEPETASLAAARLGETAARAGGETGEIAASFRQIARELANNSLLTGELEGRLLGQIAEPLERIVAGPIDRLSVACRPAVAATGATPDPARLIALTDECLAQLRAVLDKMIELETFNEVVDSLRTMIEQQEAIRRETDQQRKQRARDALKGL